MEPRTAKRAASTPEAGPPPLEVGAAHVWWARRRDARPELERLLDAVEIGRAGAYRREDDRDRFVVGCALLRIALGTYLGREPERVPLTRTCPRCGKPHGKPRLVGEAGVEASVSHAGELVAVACARAPVGVDVEALLRPIRADELARVSLAPEEAAELAALEPHERARAFLAYWTRKEAATKAVGVGLGLELREIRVSAPHDPPRLVAWPHDVAPETLSLHDLGERDRHVAALAVVGPCERVVELDGGVALASAAG